VYLAAVLKYLAAEVLELAGIMSQDYKKRWVIPRYILLTIRNDTELDEVTKNMVFADASISCHIHPGSCFLRLELIMCVVLPIILSSPAKVEAFFNGKDPTD
jgi:hypothetical protein